MTDPRISVVIPVRNGMPYIEATVRSALGQSFPVHEVIVVNDGSADGTSEVLDSFGDRIRHVKADAGSPGNARNVGMALVTGDWVAFLDGDDVWFRDKLRRQVEVFKAHPTADLICCNYIWRGRPPGRLKRHYENVRALKSMRFDVVQDGPETLRFLSYGNFIGVPSAVLVRKSVVEAVGGFGGGPFHIMCEDYDYWIRCTPNVRSVVMKEALLYKREHRSNISSDQFSVAQNELNILKFTLRDMRKYIDAHGLTGAWHDGLARCYYRFGNLNYEAGKKHDAFVCFFKGLSCRHTPMNALRFARAFFGKSIRFLSGGIISRKTLASLRNAGKRRAS